MTRRSFGAPIEAYLEHLLEDLEADRNELRRYLLDKEREFRGPTANSDLSGPEIRIRDQFAAVYAAGALAVRYEVLPWTQAKQLNASKAAWKASLEFMRSQRGPTDDDLETAIRNFLRSLNLASSDHSGPLPGEYDGWISNGSDATEQVCILTRSWTDARLGGRADPCLHFLQRKGWLFSHGGKRVAQRRRAKARYQVYVVSSHLLRRP